MRRFQWLAALTTTIALMHALHGDEDSSPAPAMDGPPWAVTFAEELERLIASGDIAAAEETVDARALFERTVESVEASAEELDAMWEGFRPRVALFAVVGNAWAGGGHYRLMRVRVVEDQPRALFRLVTSEGLVNYHDLLLRRDGAWPSVIDMHIAVTGEWISATMGRIMAMSMQGGRRTEEAINRLQRFQRLAEREEYEAALEAWRVLPRRLREDKGVLIQRLHVAMHVSDERSGRRSMTSPDSSKTIRPSIC